MQAPFLPQLTTMVPPAFQFPQPQSMEQMAPVTPEMGQAAAGRGGELPVTNVPAYRAHLPVSSAWKESLISSALGRFLYVNQRQHLLAGAFCLQCKNVD